MSQARSYINRAATTATIGIVDQPRTAADRASLEARVLVALLEPPAVTLAPVMVAVVVMFMVAFMPDVLLLLVMISPPLIDAGCVTVALVVFMAPTA